MRGVAGHDESEMKRSTCERHIPGCYRYTFYVLIHIAAKKFAGIIPFYRAPCLTWALPRPAPLFSAALLRHGGGKYGTICPNKQNTIKENKEVQRIYFKKRLILAAVLALFVAPAWCDEGDDDNQKLDELGQVPRLRTKFDGSFDSFGDEAPSWEFSRSMKPQWAPSRGGKALRLGGSTDYPSFGSLSLGAEWSIVVIAKGVEGEKMIFTLGDGRGRGAKSIGLAGTGKGGVKLVTWHGRQEDNSLIAMKNVVHFDKQFHVYAIVKQESGHLSLWVDGKKAGEPREFDQSGMGTNLRLGAFHWVGKAAGLENGEGVEIDDFRVYDTALSEVQILQVASANAPWPEGLPMPRERVSAYIDTNSVLRLGYEIPENVVIGEGGEKRLYAKGVLAQCGIGGEKRFELRPGGLFALGGEGLVFDSNYARARTNELVFAGGAIAAFEPTMIKSAAPIRLEGDIKLIASKSLAIRASIEGTGNIVKGGAATLGLQYPCDKATGKLTVSTPSMLVIGPAGSWGGTVELTRGATLRCVSTNQIGKIIAPPGSFVKQSEPGRAYGEEAFPKPTTAYKMDKMLKERMGRGVYAVRQTPDEVMIGWRYKSGDPQELAFNVYANGKKLNSAPIKDVTYFKTPWKGEKTEYEVRGVLGAKEGHFRVSATWTLPADAPVGYFDIELTPPPPTEMPDGKLAKHIPYDCSVGDLDGDGEYELVVIWWPDNAGDNSSWHKTGNTWIEGVKLDGSNRSLWKIDLGPNIRSGSHYVPVMVCDMDGDGRAEVVCRTADGTRDASGHFIGDGRVDWRKKIPGAHILWANNFVTAFDGATGKEIDSVPFKPDVLSDPEKRRAMDEKAINREWSSRNPGNQAFRMLGAVAYLDGEHPSVVMCRGYYSRTCLCAYDLVDRKLQERWYFCSDEPRWWGYGGQGFHNLRVGDIDFDGKDEIIYGHMVVDHDGKGLHTTGGGHGDAIHLIQSGPDTRGLQVWSCHESAPYGVTLWDAQTGRRIFHKDGPMDTGSCNAMDIDPATPGTELFSGCNLGIYSATTLQQYTRPKPNPRRNYYNTLRFGIWWHGNMARSAYSGGSTIWDYSNKRREVWPIAEFGEDVHSNHSTKGCPNLVADLFGDWREEIFLTRNDNRAIRVFMSPEDTPYRFHTFMEDPVYRISVLTQNNGYNMPTDPGFYFGPELLGHKITFRGTYLP